MHLTIGSRTDKGWVRGDNQDRLLVDSPLFVVADGMGGARGGARAAELAVEVMQSYVHQLKLVPDPGPLLTEAAVDAHRRILAEGLIHPELHGMGTTLTGAVAIGGGKLVLVHVGDSRAYRFRGGVLEQLTRDDSYVQELIDLGQLTGEQAKAHPQRSVITKALGAGELDELRPAVFVADARNRDRFLLCSDGLPTMLSDTEVSEVLRHTPEAQAAADELVSVANQRHSVDNVTVVIIDVVEGGGEGLKVDVPALVTPKVDDDDTGETPAAVLEPEGSEVDGEPERRSRRWLWKSLIGLGVIVVLLAALVVGGRWYLLTNYYVSCDAADRVAVYRGVPHGILGFDVSRLDHVATPPISCKSLDKPPRGGVTVSDKIDAEQSVANFRCQADATTCPPTPTIPVGGPTTLTTTATTVTSTAPPATVTPTTVG